MIINKSNKQSVRVAVIGAGVMGRNHLRVYDMLKNVELVGYYDPDENVSESIFPSYEIRAFKSIEEVIESVDAVSICSPSSTHGEMGLHFLNSGVHCLIEKPLATNEDECIALIKAAKSNNAKLLVGHIERFNPAVQQLAVLFDNNTKIYAIDARRLSSVSSRITDVDVVADLMVHDLDIVMALMKSKVVSVESNAVMNSKSNLGDHVIAMLRFENGSIANITASRITQNTIRKLSLTTEAGFIDVDYMNQSIEVYLQDEIKTSQGKAAKFGDYALDISMERVLVRRTEPLQIELSHFIDIILNDEEPIVSGEEGLKAFKMVRQIQNCIKQGLD